MPAHLIKYLKFILTRTIILYLACFFLIWRILDYHSFINNAVDQTMSRLTPPMDYFAEFVDKEDHYDQFKLLNCINYHQAVAHFYTIQKAEAYGMLGFCYERLGQQPQAIASYKQAIALNPDYFWPYYNLGVIFYNQAQYPKAEDYLTRAIEQDPIRTIVLLSRSKVYRDVNLSRQKGWNDFLQGLKQGRVEAYILLMDSLYKTGSYEQLCKIAVEGFNEGLDTHNANTLMYMGMCLKMANKADMAQVFINEAAQLHQQGGSVLEQYLKPRVRFF